MSGPGLRALFVALVAPAVAAAGCHGGGPAKTGEQGAGDGTTAARSPARRPLRVSVARTGKLAAPIQLPATAALRDGSVLLMGGLDARDVSSAAITRVTGAAHASVVGSLPSPLHDAAGAPAGGGALFVGGGNQRSSDAILRVSPAGGARQIGRLPRPASDVAAAVVGATTYVVGGYDGSAGLRSIVAVDPRGRTRVAGSLPRPLRYAAVAATGGRVVIAGGTSGTRAQRAVLSFDPSTGRIRQIATLPRPLTHAAAAPLAGRVCLIGGRGDSLDSQTSDVWAIAPNGGALQRVAGLPLALSDVGAARAGKAIVVAGGRDRSGTVHDTILELTPSA